MEQILKFLETCDQLVFGGDATAQLQPPPFELAKETRNLAHLVAEFATREVNYRATLPPGSAR